MARKPTRRFRNRHTLQAGQLGSVLPSIPEVISYDGSIVELSFSLPLVGNASLSVDRWTGNADSLVIESTFASRVGDNWQASFPSWPTAASFVCISAGLRNSTGGLVDSSPTALTSPT